MKKIFMILIFCICTGVAMAENNYIKIHGKIDPSILTFFNSRELLIKIHDPAKKLNDEEMIIAIAVDKDNGFEARIPIQTRFNYLSFWIQNLNRTNSLTTRKYPIQYPAVSSFLLDMVYLFKQGDEVMMVVSKDGQISFSGQGADKLNCQNLLYKQPNLTKGISSRNLELKRMGNNEQANQLEDEVFDLEISLIKKLMNTYLSQLDQETFNRLYLNAIGWPIYLKLYPTLNFKTDAEQAEQKLRFDHFIQKQYVAKVESGYFSESAFFSEMLFLKEWTAYRLNSNEHQGGGNYRDFYEIIKRKYTGLLKDQLILISLRKLNGRYNEEIKTCIDELINTVEQADYKEAIQTFKKRQFKIAFPFELEDSESRIYKLNDYKGKVVVVDFWFTGCSGCVTLNQVMHHIIDEYKNSKDIVFITVSEDQDKSVWINSLSTGRYTSPGTINLYTNGMGVNHSLLKFYNFVGAPQQLIIDRLGNLVTAKPPRPDGGISRLIDMKSKDQVLANPNAVKFMKILNDELIK